MAVELNSELPIVYLQAGEAHLTRSPAILRTVLGSCVGVTFWCARLGAGALCHAVLPRRPDARVVDSYRYVDSSIRCLVSQFEELGARRQELVVKVFGGADVLPVGASAAFRQTVGWQNCRAAIEVLESEGLAVTASDLGGTQGRAIRFYTGSGVVLLERLAAQAGDQS